MPRRDRPRIAVIGGGFSGLLTAIHLLRRIPRVTVHLVEKAPRFGLGRAYACVSRHQLLNVRATNMSAFPELPDHFATWLAGLGIARRGFETEFVSRGLYGEYLQELLRAAVGPQGHPGRLLLEQDEAADVELGQDDGSVRLAMGRSLRVDAVVLAVGLAPPTPLAAGLGHSYVHDPWSLDPVDAPLGEILVIGSGLTMVDLALSLDHPDRRLLVVSRRGLRPRPHDEAKAAPPPSGSFATPVQAMRRLRAHAARVGWRSAVDSLRPITPAIWAGWDLAARRRFLRHARPWWDAHRHRMAPQAAARLEAMAASGRLRVLAARLESLECRGEGLEACLRPRGSSDRVRRSVVAAIDCTGLSGDLTQMSLPARLVVRGLLRPDPLGLGVDVDADFRVIGATGRPTAGLYAVGPLTRGARWETVAAPDLRSQTHEVAAVIHADLSARSSRVAQAGDLETLGDPGVRG